MKITNEDYIREIKRFLRPPSFIYDIDYSCDLLVIYYSPGTEISLKMSDMSNEMKKIYGKKIVYEIFVKDSFKSLNKLSSITFPSSYEELCIINDLKGN